MHIENRKAFFNYELLEKIEAGIVLKGPEVKSLRAGRGSIKESYAKIENGEVYLYNFHISNYENTFEKDNPLRKKKLLLTKREIKRISKKVEEKGLTIIPVSVYFDKKGLAKVQIAVAKGKKLYDKRRVIKERELKISIERRLKGR
ncbi:SsrA-binding protein SmpB [bacterium]|nr:SsrA-binding protein SmpB [bacterium]